MKTHLFTFFAQSVEVYNPSADPSSFSAGAQKPFIVYPRIVKELTWSQAKEFFKGYVDSFTEPVACYMYCAKPTPKGFKKYKKIDYSIPVQRMF